MKFLILLTTFVVLGNAVSVDDHWTEFKIKHSKVYKNIKEEQARLNIFSNNLRKIEEHNERYQRGEVSYYLGINKFADMTSEEYKDMLGLQKASMPKPNVTSHFVSDPKRAVPDSIDWREKGAVTPIRNQHYPHQCGSCWAHSTAASLESHRFIHENVLEVLSVQQIMDCSSDYGNDGCEGGSMDAALHYVEDNGICAESSYKYEAIDRTTCKPCDRVIKTFKDVFEVEGNEEIMKEVVGTIGPVTVAVRASDWQLYAGGVYDGECGGAVNHGVVIVGYGEENGKSYWLIKNSHGTDFGENGYIRLGRGLNMCDIINWVNYPKF